jgi:hypothetical protein
MIAFAKFQEAERLLAIGKFSRRRIAAIVGISRATVSAIASGKYQDRLERERARAKKRADEYHPTGQTARCPECGGLVLVPCLACRMRKQKDREEKLLREHRRRARQRALVQLLHAVRKAHWQRESEEHPVRTTG